MNVLIKIIMALAIGLLAEHASADIKYIAPSSQIRDVRDFGYIEIRGEITREDGKKLPVLLETATQRSTAKSSAGSPVVIVFLDSPGGDLLAAMIMGQLLHDVTARIWVSTGSQCSSACIFILASGAERHVAEGALLGIHRPYFEQTYFAGLPEKEARRRYTSLADASRKYLHDMGMVDQLFDDMLKIPSQKVRLVDLQYAEQVGLTGKDPGHEEWERARTAQQHGNDYVDRMDQLIDCINAGTRFDICTRKIEGR